jgi:hypothetical protein
MKSLSHDSCPGQDSNWTPTKCKSQVLTQLIHLYGLHPVACSTIVMYQEPTTTVGYTILSFFLGWGETESTWYVGHYLAYCTGPG